MSDHMADKIQQDIEQTRAGISRTLDALQERLSPDALIADTLRSARVGDALKSAGAGGAAFASNLGRVVAEHPLPLVLTGVGLTWLAISGGRTRSTDVGNGGGKADWPHRREPGYDADAIRASGMSDLERMDMSSIDIGNQPRDSGDYPDEHIGARSGIAEAGSGIAEAGSGIAEKAKSVAAEARTRAGEVGERAAESIKKASDVVSGKAERVSEAVKHTGAVAYERTKGAAQRVTHVVREVPARVGDAAQNVGGFVQENPVLVGAIAAALGAGLALLIPSSRRESEVLGEASDEVKTTVRDAVGEQVDRVKSVARTAAEAAADAARREVSGDDRDAGAAVGTDDRETIVAAGR